MLRPFGPRRDLARVLAALAYAATLVACGSPGSQRIIGPDGSPMAHVHCGDDQGACFRIAGELCPSGYDFRPVLSGNDGNFLVRCRAASANVTAAAAPLSPASAPPSPAPARVTPLVPTPAQTWPPAPEPARAANPWPAQDTNAATSRAGAAATPAGELDLGY